MGSYKNPVSTRRYNLRLYLKLGAGLVGLIALGYGLSIARSRLTATPVPAAPQPVPVTKAGHSLEEAAADFVVANRPSSIIRRAASVEEVANIVIYTASPQASATTGAALRVDGGVVDTIV